MSPAKLLLPIFGLSVALVLVAIGQDRAPHQGNAPKVLDRAAAPSSRGSAAVGPRIAEAYAKLPLSFEANQGQTDPRAKFLSRGNGYTLFLTPDQLVFVLSNSSGQATKKNDLLKAQKSDPTKILASVLRIKLEDSDPHAQVEGFDELPGKSNYFVGNDPKMWRTSVPTYARVKIRAVYSGVDLVYYGNQRQLENDFIISPGADPSSIRIGLAGANTLSLDASGNLVVAIGEGQLRFQKPVVYQEIDGVRHEIAGSYVLKERYQVGFQVSAYDTSRPLIIDPVLSYSTYLGGNGGDYGSSIVVDSSGNAYVTGTTTSTNFPTTSGAFQNSLSDSICAFVAKLNPTGSGLVYSTYLGGSVRENGLGIALDSAGDAYITGTTYSTNFPTTGSAFQSTYPGGTVNAFVTELNPTGSGLVYSTYLGGGAGIGDSEGDGIAVDAAGDAYVAGFTGVTNFPTTAGAFQTTYLGAGGHGFVTKFNPTGSGLVYSTYLEGSTGVDAGQGIAVDSSGDAYVTGQTSSTDFPTSSGAFQTAYGGVDDGFVTELNPSGSGIIYSTYLGGSNFDNALGIAVDSAGDAYVTGITQSTDFPTTSGALQTTYGGGTDGFVTKLNPTGSGIIYSTYLGGSSFDDGLSIGVDSSGNASVTGATSSTNFPTTSCAFQTTYGGGAANAFVTTLNPTGSAPLYSTYLGGSGNDYGSGIAVDSAGDTYVTGGASSPNFPTTSGAFQTTLGGSSNAFVAMIANTFLPLTITSANSTTFQIGAAGSFAVTTSGCPAPTVTESGALPSGVTFTAGALTGTPAAGSGGTYNIIFTASNGVGPNAVQNFTLTVDQAPAITSTNATTFTVGTPGAFTLTATGFPAPAVTESGALPSGVTFTAGALTGTPAAGSGGTYNIIFTASNGVSPNAMQNFTLTVDQAPAITSTNTMTFAVGMPGLFTVTATGFPTPTITESGALPSGVTFSGGVLSGTPAPGSNETYIITLTASNSAGTATQIFTLVIATLEISPTSVNFGTLYWGQLAVRFVTLTNAGGMPITISSIKVTLPGNALGDYGDITSCAPGIPAMPGTLGAGKSCTIAVVILPTAKIFAPTASTATLTITDSAARSPQLVPLSATVRQP